MSEAQFDPEYVFSHHHATPQKLADYEAIHTGAKKFAQVLLAHVPECEDRHEVLRLLRRRQLSLELRGTLASFLPVSFEP